jgi:hypothetical protein
MVNGGEWWEWVVDEVRSRWGWVGRVLVAPCVPIVVACPLATNPLSPHARRAPHHAPSRLCERGVIDKPVALSLQRGII